MSSIDFSHIYKSYPGAGLVLDDFNFTVPSSGFVSLVGPTGCGKSTLLRLALGLDTLDEGEILYGIARPTRSIAFQEPRLLPWLSVRDNLELVRHRYPSGDMDVDELLALVGLSRFADAYPKVLSGGMAQRASLARALAVDPDVLLLDEPFSAVDALTRMKLQDALVRIYTARPRTTIMVTHDIDEALLTSRQVLVLSARPARIVDVVEIPAGYPRHRSDATLFHLKARILRGLGLEDEAMAAGTGI
ncbi:ABC transporter related protein [Dehalogenimonas lykanthroporepellens BL-DC-9]|jgi:ABC-type nitrate/sulfonate/bicarbonate transport system ATPase subunit|nr:ABC transporter related protein [Dehalogenimonas lykanthroporepellens BL-DC-9]